MPASSEYDDALDPAGIARVQREKLAALLAEMLPRNAFWNHRLGHIVDSLIKKNMGETPVPQFTDFPLTSRADLLEDQRLHPPYGSNLTYPIADYRRLHQTSGTASGSPLRCLDRAEDWAWWKKCWSAVYRAAGITPGDRLIFPFSFGPFVGFWAGFECACDLGCLALPAGGMTTIARLRFLLDNGATVICCTPTYAMHMAEVARGESIDLARSSVRALIVAGEPGGNIPSVRSAIETAYGARVFDHVGMTEMGAYAFECLEAPGGVHVNEAEFIAEIIDPATGKIISINTAEALDKLPPVKGEGGCAPYDGELVLTNLGRSGMPMIRYRTGDHVRLTRGKCRCGRWFARLEGGIIGRTDDMLIIRGNNVYPSAIEAILRGFLEVVEFRLTVADQAGLALDRLPPVKGLADLRIDVEPARDAETDGLADRVTHAIRDRLSFRPQVTLVPPGSLPRFEMKARRVVRET